MSTGAGAGWELAECTVQPDAAPLPYSGAAPALPSSKKLHLIDPDVEGKRMFIRVDLDVPNVGVAGTRVDRRGAARTSTPPWGSAGTLW